MSISEINAMHPPLCSIHHEPLTVFCKICDVAICIHCLYMDHKEWEGKGKHVTISITDAFITFKQTSEELEKVAKQCTDKLNDDLKVMTDHVKKLEEKREKSLRGIESHVEELVRRIKDSGDKLKSEVEAMYKIKRKATDADIEDVTTTVSYINTNINLLHHLKKSNEATAMLSGNNVVRILDEKVKAASKTQYDRNADINFVKNNQQIVSLNEDIGMVTESREADCFEIRGAESMTTGQTLDVKIIKTDDCEINANDIKATLTQPTGETIITEVEEDINGDYTVIGRCTSAGICKVDVRVDGEHIKKSPMSINVQKEGLLNTIKIDNVKDVKDVVKYGDDCLLVLCQDNVIHKYKQTGENIGTGTLSGGVKVCRMYTMNNGNIAFSDRGNECITVCTTDGKVVKSFGKEVLRNPWGIHVDEASRVMYVANDNNVVMFNIESRKLIKKIAECDITGSEFVNIIDVTLTRQGHILVLYLNESCLKQFDNEGKLLKEIVNKGDEDGKVKCPNGVVVDDDDNIIISSWHKLQQFSNSGKFIKRIDKKEDGIKNPKGLSIISHHPRRLAVANKGDKTVKIFNY
ncbi:uncharacterized protein [Antedon mediterranea]|uniref:uncharacterized protein n=1 Tax=Antedon mediterranea TaxID=105859 RepID=UPI003AF860F9